MLYLGCQFTLCAKFWVSKSFLALGNQKMWFSSLWDLKPPTEIYYRKLINWVIQKLSTLISQQATVHIYDWLTKVKQIYESSCLLVHAINQFQTMRFLNVFGVSSRGAQKIILASINPLFGSKICGVFNVMCVAVSVANAMRGVANTTCKQHF